MARTRERKGGASAPADRKEASHLFPFTRPTRERWPWQGHSTTGTRPAGRSSERRAGTGSSIFYLSPGRYEYRFVVDGIWTDDPAARPAAGTSTAARTASSK